MTAIAVCHTGADLLTRACYMPDTWGLRVAVCDGGGFPRDDKKGDRAQLRELVGKLLGRAAAEDKGAEGAELVVQDVAGPLCFQGGGLRRLSTCLCVVCFEVILSPAWSG